MDSIHGVFFFLWKIEWFDGINIEIRWKSRGVVFPPAIRKMTEKKVV